MPVFTTLRIFCQALSKRRIAMILMGMAVLGAWSIHGGRVATTLSPGSEQASTLSRPLLDSAFSHAFPNNPPKVSITAKPVLTENKTLRLAYNASDDFGVTEVALRITPRDPLPGANNDPVEIPLPVPAAKQISRTDFQDLTARPWAGQAVAIQIVATNESGKRSLSDAFDFTLPERRFFHPIARVLIEERKKLMLHPEDETLHEEAANIMASIAQQTASYRGDPVIFMALRSGAVRLVLGHNKAAAISVNDLLWQTATRIENGSQTTAQRTMREQQQNLTDH